MVLGHYSCVPNITVRAQTNNRTNGRYQVHYLPRFVFDNESGMVFFLKQRYEDMLGRSVK